MLGCTHFPYYKSILQQILPPHIELIDGSQGTVERLCSLIGGSASPAQEYTGHIEFSCSDENPAYLAKMARALDYLQSQYR
ncbi:glutamate racemase [compost metagenome]